MMKPKQTIDPNVAGEEFKKLLAEDRTALKDIRAGKAARKQQLKAALTVVWEAFDKGVTVNGYSTRGDWAKKFAGYSLRQCEYMVYGRPNRTGENANRGSHLKLLKELITFIADEGVTKDALVNIRAKAAEIAGEELNWEPEVWKKEIEERKEQLGMPAAPAPITHAKVSARKTLCERHYINRPPLKPRVFAAKWGEATCPDCTRFQKEADEKNRAFDEETDKLYAETKKSVADKLLAEAQTPVVENEDGVEFTDVRIKLTSAQYREAGELAKELGIGWSPAVTLVFEADGYQSQAKALVVALEAKIAELDEAYNKWRNSQNQMFLGKLLDWTNKSPEALAAKKVRSTKQSAIKACEGAIIAVIGGDYSDDPKRSIDDWYHGEHYEEVERQADETYKKRIAELDAKIAADSKPTLTVVVNETELYTVTCLTCGNQRTDDESNTLVTLPSNGAQNAARYHCQKCGTKASVYNKKKFASKPVQHTTEPEYDKEAYAKAETWGQKVCIKGSPENLAHIAQLEHQRQYPYVDPNEGDEFEGEGQ